MPYNIYRHGKRNRKLEMEEGKLNFCGFYVDDGKVDLPSRFYFNEDFGRGFFWDRTLFRDRSGRWGRLKVLRDCVLAFGAVFLFWSKTYRRFVYRCAVWGLPLPEDDKKSLMLIAKAAGYHFRFRVVVGSEEDAGAGWTLRCSSAMSNIKKRGMGLDGLIPPFGSFAELKMKLELGGV